MGLANAVMDSNVNFVLPGGTYILLILTFVHDSYKLSHDYTTTATSTLNDIFFRTSCASPSSLSKSVGDSRTESMITRMWHHEVVFTFRVIANVVD